MLLLCSRFRFRQLCHRTVGIQWATRHSSTVRLLDLFCYPFLFSSFLFVILLLLLVCLCVGCNADGLFNASALETASRFSLLTVEKGQGLAQPGYADDKIAALAAQWKGNRKTLGLSDGWAMFYINANFDWKFYRLHTEMLIRPSWAIQMDGAEEGKPCL